MRACPPRIAVQKSTVAWYSRSVPGCGPRGRCVLLRAGKDARKNILEAAPRPRTCARLLLRAARAAKPREIEAAKIHRRLIAPRLLPRIRLGLRRVDLVGVEAKLVIHLALLLVAQNVVGLGDFLELLLRLLVPRIHVRVIPPRQLAKGLANLLRRGCLLHPEHRVIIFVRRCGHCRVTRSPVSCNALSRSRSLSLSAACSLQEKASESACLAILVAHPVRG